MRIGRCRSPRRWSPTPSTRWKSGGSWTTRRSRERPADPGAVTGPPLVEDLLRELAPQVLGTLVRRHGQFDACEDAVQEALLAAALCWPAEGVPDRPRSWLLTVAGRALVDAWRADSARRRREATAALVPAGQASAADDSACVDRLDLGGTDRDDTLGLLFLCCHPALSPRSQ